MNYSELGLTIKDLLEKAIKTVNSKNVDPDLRRLNLTVLLGEVGNAIYNKIFDMNAWDLDVLGAIGDGIPEQMYGGLAKIISDSVVIGGEALVASQIDAFIKTTIALAQKDATKIAADSNKRPQLKRELHGDTCQWCRRLSTGGRWIDEPSSEYFARHRDCDCRIFTRGYHSRNGELKNYVKPKDR